MDLPAYLFTDFPACHLLHTMKILDLKVMRGPNIWSNYRQSVVVMQLDLGEL